MEPQAVNKSAETRRRNRERQEALGLKGAADTRPLTGIKIMTGFHDAGPSEPGAPSAFCPHCGSGGRYVWTFIGTDGSQRGAMKGCVKLFQVSWIAKSQMDSIERFLKDWQAHRSGSRKYPPASWDAEIYSATDDVASGAISVEEAEAKIHASLSRRSAFLKRMKSRRTAR